MKTAHLIERRVEHTAAAGEAGLGEDGQQPAMRTLTCGCCNPAVPAAPPSYSTSALQWPAVRRCRAEEMRRRSGRAVSSACRPLCGMSPTAETSSDAPTQSQQPTSPSISTCPLRTVALSASRSCGNSSSLSTATPMPLLHYLRCVHCACASSLSCSLW